MLKHLSFSLWILFVVALSPTFAQGPENPDQWDLVFVDEFDGEKLDYSKWTPRDPWELVRNDELQAYIVKAFRVQEGILKIISEHEPAFYDGAKRDYRSGMMTTSGKFAQRYGRFEIRCQVPKGRGLWPAFWLLPDPPSWPPEIDILEILCHETDKVYLTNHWVNPAAPGGDSLSVTEEYQGEDFAVGFHTLAIEWEKGEIRWYVDGTQRFLSRSGVPDVPMFLMVNLAVGGWAGEPDASTRFPAEYQIDYIKVWKKKGFKE